MNLPETISTESELDEVMTRPAPAVVDWMRELDGDLLILGVGGKMGVSLAWQAVRACEAARVKKRVIGVSRFSDAAARKSLERIGVETIAGDLLDRDTVATLPRIRNVIYMVGKKFGTGGAEDVTWAINTIVPGNVAYHLPESRVVVFSTGNVYPQTAIDSGGATEDHPTGPTGEYAQSALGRERVFTYYSKTGEMPTVLFRLNYAVDLRYGVLHDIGTKILREETLDLAMGFANVIWQGDANAQALLSLAHCESPPNVLNVTGPETVSIREIATRFGKLLGKTPRFEDQESKTALLSNSAKATHLFGPPQVSLDRMIQWTAHWLGIGGRSLGKPAHFEVRDGKY